MLFIKHNILYPIKTMKIFVWLLALLILSLQVDCQLKNCPSSCDCVGFNFACMDCIRHFHRGMTAESGGCVCLAYYKDKMVQQDYCCPLNCSTCNINGCMTCPENYQIYYNSHFSIYTCVCQPYYTSLGRDFCYCQSYISPTEFYYNHMTDKCYKCPPGCVCNQTGCISCDDPLRYIALDPFSRSVCPCKYPTKQNETSCVCPKGCDCSSGQISCNASSNRKVENGQWTCKWPYVQEDFECKCKDPYFYLEVIPGIVECVCGSKTQIAQFYEYGEGCYPCPKGCTCNQKGCYACDVDAHRTIEGFSCFCTAPYIEYQGLCICTEPYYLDPKTDTCKCIASAKPANYTRNKQSQVCEPCPTNCICNASGCIYCTPESKRTVRQLSSGRYVCECPTSASEFMTVCYCNAYSESVNNTCVCKYGQKVYNDAGVCKKCPEGCTCNGTNGCHTCNSTSFRTPKILVGSYKNCPCSEGYAQNSDFLCVCKSPYVWSTATNTCVCPEPYVFKALVGCVCRSADDPAKYYIDALTSKCHICPVGCTCNATGCHGCFPYSLRLSLLLNTSGRCPCLQNTSLYQDVCTVCPSYSYYFNGVCVQCQGCSSCNVNGCTACSTDSQLILVRDTYICQCNDGSKIFVRDQCKCGKDLYQNTTSSLCGACPKYCLDCRMQSSQVQCVTCANDATRKNSPIDNCPCIDGYTELGIIQSYCCPLTCSNCNSTGCTACPPQTHRTLVNQICVCQGNLISTTGSIICSCPSGQYMYLKECLKCPPNCLSCIYSFKTQTVNCLECRSGVNRKNHTGNITTQGGCECEDQFAQLNPQQQYCYPKHCKKQTKICEECILYREVARDGLQCRCIRGYYESELEECEPCLIEGCLACLSLSYCISCDVSNDYYLTNRTCRKNVAPFQTIYIQDLLGIYLQMRITGVCSINITKYPVLFFYTAQIEKVRKNEDISTPAYQNIDVKTQVIQLSDNSEILYILIENPVESYQNIILHLNIAFATPGALPIFQPAPTPAPANSRRELAWIFNGMDDSGFIFEGYDQDIFVFKDRVYSSKILSLQYEGLAQSQIILSITFIVIAFILHLLSFKHNGTIFFLQTISFIGFVYNDPKLDMAPFLFNMRLSYFQNETSSIPNLVDYNYLQSTEGNFQFFTLDSNLIRVAGSTIQIAAIFLGITFLLRIVIWMYEYKKSNWRKPAAVIKVTKKPIYRAIEFFYKLTMYPIIFFSIVNLHNWNAYTIVPDAQTFHNITKGLAIGFLFFYAGITLFSVFFETISKVYKIQNATEFLSDVIASIIMVSSYNQNIFLCLIIVFVTRTIIYLYSRKKYFRQFSKFQYLRVLTMILEICSICMVTTNSIIKLAPFILLTLFSQTIHSSIAVAISIKKWKTSHKGIKFTQEREQGTENVSDLKLTTEDKSSEIPVDILGILPL